MFSLSFTLLSFPKLTFSASEVATRSQTKNTKHNLKGRYGINETKNIALPLWDVCLEVLEANQFMLQLKLCKFKQLEKVIRTL